MTTAGEEVHRSEDCFNPLVKRFTRRKSGREREGLTWKKLQQNVQKKVKRIFTIVSENANWFVVINLF